MVTVPLSLKLIGHLIVVKPEDPVAYMLHFLEKQIGKATKKLTMDERTELNNLRTLQEYLQKKLVKLQDKQKRLEEADSDYEDEGEEDEAENDSDGSRPPTHSASSEDDEEEDDIDELPPTLKAPPKFRKSVSAEAYGLYNKKGYFSARTVDKDQDAKDHIKDRLMQSFMFNSLSEKDFGIVVDAMEIKKFDKNDTVIEQNDDGDELFVVGEGKLH